MARLPVITGEFRTTDDPELRFTPSGKAVANLTVVASESKKNEQTGEWEDGDRSPFIRVAVWGPAAEAVAETITKGERVLVSGALYARDYERNDGTKGQSIELKWATVAAIPGGKSKAQREAQANGGNGYAYGQQQQRQQAQDPWATPAGGQGQDPWATNGTPRSDEPPF